MAAAHDAAILRQLSHGILETLATERQRDGNCLEGFARRQGHPPMVLDVCGAEQCQIRDRRPNSHMLAYLPVPGAVVLDLPQQRVPGPAVDGRAHWQVGPRGPGSRARDGKASPRPPVLNVAAQLGERFTKAPGLPARLGLPVVLSPEYVDVSEIPSGSGEAAAEERRHGLDRERGAAGVLQRNRAAQHPDVGEAPVDDARRKSRNGVVQRDLQQAPGSVLSQVVADVAHPVAHHRL